MYVFSSKLKKKKKKSFLFVFMQSFLCKRLNKLRFMAFSSYVAPIRPQSGMRVLDTFLIQYMSDMYPYSYPYNIGTQVFEEPGYWTG